MSKPTPWWLQPRNQFAEAIYPHLTEHGKEKANTPRAKREAQNFHARRGATSPLGGQAKPEPKRK